MSSTDDLSQHSMLDLFRLEAENQAQILNTGLLALERQPRDPEQLEACMRAAHSLKGAARIVGVNAAVAIAHAMEDCFVAAQHDRLTLHPDQIDHLLGAVDLLLRIANPPGGATDWDANAGKPFIENSLAQLSALLHGTPAPAPIGSDATATPAPAPGASAPSDPASATTSATPPASASATTAPPQPATASAGAAPVALLSTAATPAGTPAVPARAPAVPEAAPVGQAVQEAHAGNNRRDEPDRRERRDRRSTDRRGGPEGRAQDSGEDGGERVLRVSAAHLNRLLSLSGEAVVEARWLKGYAQAMLRLKRLQRNAARTLEQLHEHLDNPARRAELFTSLHEQLSDCQNLLAEQLVGLESHDQRTIQVAQRLYDQALASRMRPFADGVANLPRVVRDLGRELGKQVRLEIAGEHTQVDRDILEKLDAPLGHLIRNAVDHGIEDPATRAARGKPPEGVLTLEARHHAGLLQISLTDDGEGIDVEAVRRAVVARNLSRPEVAPNLSNAELLEFLFLPGFSMRTTVTEISGRGVGLDAVQNMVKQVRGTVRVFTQPGQGTRFLLQLPLTLSVVRSLLVEIGGEPYALPLAHVGSTLMLEEGQIELLEGRQHFQWQGRRIGLATAHQILHPERAIDSGASTPVVLIGDAPHTVGLAVDRFLGEHMLVVQPLDARLSKIKDIASGALMEDGTPVQIIDVEDMLRSIEKLISTGQIEQLRTDAHAGGARRATAKRILVADDSLTVRELERKLLSSRGYDVAVAVDGMDGWNALRTEAFDLLVTDVDMPRMDGIELVRLVKADPNLRNLPVMIVSYKDREEDRQRGLDAGADYYLAKGSFHDNALLDAVLDLIGEPGLPDTP